MKIKIKFLNDKSLYQEHLKLSGKVNTIFMIKFVRKVERYSNRLLNFIIIPLLLNVNLGYAGDDEVRLRAEINVPTTLIGRLVGKGGQNVSFVLEKIYVNEKYSSFINTFL